MCSDKEWPLLVVTPTDLIYGRKVAVTALNQQHEVVSTAKLQMKWAIYQLWALSTFINQWLKDYLLHWKQLADTFLLFTKL